MTAALPTAPPPRDARRPGRVLVVGATGTIGRATVRALAQDGHEIVCFVRPRRGTGRPGTLGTPHPDALAFPDADTVGITMRVVDVGDPASVARDGFGVHAGERFDAVISCLASRTGAPADAWAVDYQAHVHVLEAARRANVGHFVYLSAICVQKPRLAFQHAKLAFERRLAGSGVPYSIVRPTAFFKSLSGQVARVRRGKPFLVVGDGMRTACKPIADADVAAYLVGCLDDPARRDRVLPIGGPGAAITPRQQGELLFALLGRPPRFTHVSPRLLDSIAGTLGALARVVPPLAPTAELARIGRYYATESMLVWDASAGRYDADATPSVGRGTLDAHYRALLSGEAAAGLGAHAVF